MGLRMGKRPAIEVAGKKIVLNDAEYNNAQRIERQITRECQHIFMNERGYNRRVANNLGALVDITTLTTILKSISVQKFYQIPFAKYIPLKVGEGAWSQTLLGYTSFDVAESFEEGVIDTGADNSRLASVDTAVSSVPTPVMNWAKSIGWSLPELFQAARAGNWDLVSAKEKARKRNWDLGLQELAFLGLRGRNGVNGKIFGLLNLPGIEYNTQIIPEALKSMDFTEINTFVQNVISDYREYCQYTVYPNRFVIPESDYNGLAAQVSPEFPVKNKLQLLLEAFRVITMDQSFEILPVAYANAAQHAYLPNLTGFDLYALYRFDEETVQMNIPVDYTNTLANSLNGFNFQAVGFGQFTGGTTYRPREIRYYKVNAT